MFRRDNKQALSASTAETLVWDLTTWTQAPAKRALGPALRANFSRDGNFVMLLQDACVRVLHYPSMDVAHVLSENGENRALCVCMHVYVCECIYICIYQRDFLLQHVDSSAARDPGLTPMEACGRVTTLRSTICLHALVS